MSLFRWRARPQLEAEIEASERRQVRGGVDSEGHLHYELVLVHGQLQIGAQPALQDSSFTEYAHASGTFHSQCHGWGTSTWSRKQHGASGDWRDHQLLPTYGLVPSIHKQSRRLECLQGSVSRECSRDFLPAITWAQDSARVETQIPSDPSCGCIDIFHVPSGLEPCPYSDPTCSHDRRDRFTVPIPYRHSETYPPRSTIQLINWGFRSSYCHRLGYERAYYKWIYDAKVQDASSWAQSTQGETYESDNKRWLSSSSRFGPRRWRFLQSTSGHRRGITSDRWYRS